MNKAFHDLSSFVAVFVSVILFLFWAYIVVNILPAYMNYLVDYNMSKVIIFCIYKILALLGILVSNLAIRATLKKKRTLMSRCISKQKARTRQITLTCPLVVNQLSCSCIL